MMQSYGTIIAQNSNAAFNDPARAAKIREEKFKRKLMEIEKTGAEQLKQQELANKGASDVQGLRNTGELANTQLTGDIQSGLRESQIKENLSQAGLYKAQATESDTSNVLRAAQANRLDKESRLQQLEGDITERYGMRIGEAKLGGVEAANKYAESNAAATAAQTSIEQKKAEGLINPDSLTSAGAMDLFHKRQAAEDEKAGIKRDTTYKDPPFSIAETSDSIYNLMPTVGLARGAIKGSKWIADLPGQIRDAIKKKKIVLE